MNCVRPIEHFVVALVPVLAYVLVRDRMLPAPTLVLVVFFGSQFPDLVDKPLAHVLGLIPSGRVFMHSLPFALPLSALVLAYAWRTRRLWTGCVFVIAYLSHLFADNHRVLFGQDPHIPNDLLWPFVPPTPRPDVPYWVGPNSINLHLWTAFSVLTLAIAAYVLAGDLKEQFDLWQSVCQ